MERKSFLLKRLWLLLFWPISALLTLAAVKMPAFAEWYALHPYLWISRGGNFLSSLVPFSFAELIIFLLLASTPFLIILWLLRLIKAEKRVRFLYTAVINFLCLLGILSFFFTSACGINYYRYSFAKPCGFEVKPSSEKELEELCNQLANTTNSLRLKVHVDKNNVMGLYFSDIQQVGKTAQNAFDAAQKKYPTLPTGYSVPKPVISSHAMSACQLTGIYFPFTFEANFNKDIPDYSIPSTMCHELAHLHGYMREDEANFISYLVCKNSNNVDFQYSGNMLAFIHASNALFAENPDAGQKLYASLNEGVRNDLQANFAYWKQFEGPVANAANKMNDTYLKANRQQDGVKSYGRMVDLLLAEYHASK